MVTGRLGYAWDRTLLYVKGGVAFVPTRASVVDVCQNTVAGCGNWLISTAGSNTVTTWTVGGGIEWAFALNWSVKGEYMFIALDNDNGFQSCGAVTTPSGAILAGGPFCFNNAFSGIHTAKIGLNYRFAPAGY
jgi:outer membrane immunogenic protein